MQLWKLSDPRHPIHKLSRKELEYLARSEKRTDIVPGMPAELMKRKFMGAPPSRMPRPMRNTIGSAKELRVPPYDDWLRLAFGIEPPRAAEPEIVQVNALDDLEAQWKAEQATPKPATEPENKRKRTPRIVLMRRECKARGIPWKLTDKMPDLEAKLNGQDAA